MPAVNQLYCWLIHLVNNTKTVRVRQIKLKWARGQGWDGGDRFGTEGQVYVPLLDLNSGTDNLSPCPEPVPSVPPLSHLRPTSTNYIFNLILILV